MCSLILANKKSHLLYEWCSNMKAIRPEIIKPFSCSTQLSMNFQRLIKTKIQMKKFLALSLSNVVVGILTLMSRINFVFS